MSSVPFGSSVPLTRIVETLTPTPLRILSATDELPPVGDIAIHDPADGRLARPGELVLGVGVRTADEISALARSLAGSAVAGLVVKFPLQQELACDLPPDLPILGLDPGASWAYLASLVRSLLGAVGGAGDAADDLFALADAVSTVVSAPVTIEDTSSRVLAFSRRQQDTDAGRHEAILGRQVPDQYIRALQERGVLHRLEHESGPIYVEALGSLQPRVAIAVRAGGNALGSIWAVVERPLTASQGEALVDAANVVALHLLRLRAESDLSGRLQSDLVEAVLEGGRGASDAARRLGIAAGPLCILAARPLAEAASDDDAIARRQLRQRLGMYSAAIRVHSVVALLHDTVYAIVVGRDVDDDSGRRMVELARGFVSRPSLGDVAVGVGRTVARPADAHRSRADADRALRVLRHEAHAQGSARRVARHADVQTGSLLLRLSDLLVEDGEALTGPLDALYAYDHEHRSGLVGTVAAYLDTFGDVPRAAASLHVHPNTFRYRLRRASEIGGVSLVDPDARLAIALQLKLRGMGAE